MSPGEEGIRGTGYLIIEMAKISPHPSFKRGGKRF
jgi:hypothetical protein